jgi:hypothetical protein
MGVIGQARQSIPAAGDYLDKDEVVRSGIPFGIANVTFSEHGGFQGNSRWEVVVTPWYEEDIDAGPNGVITMSDTAIRQAIMGSLQDMLDAKLAAGDAQLLGPVVLIRAKSKGGNRFFDFADFDEATGQAAGDGLQNVPDEAPPAPPPSAGRRRPGAPAAPPPASATPARAARASTGQRSRAQADQAAAVQAAAQPEQQSLPQQSATPIQPGVPGAPQAATAQQMVPGQIAQAKATCPDCNQEVVGRAFPDQQGNPTVIHQMCPVLKTAVPLAGELIT